MRPGRLTRLLGRVTGPALILLIVAVVAASLGGLASAASAPSAPAAEIPAGRVGIGPELRAELRELKRRGSRDAAVYEFCKATGLDEAAAEQYLNGL